MENKETKAPKKIETLKNILKAPSVEEQFRNTLQENSGTFVASIIDLFNGDKNLQECDPKQLVMEALKAAALKLPISRALGFAWLVPYKGRQGVVANFQIGYKGYIQLALRTDRYRIINADLIFQGELRKINKLTGEIDFNGEKQSDIIEGYFAHIEMLSGFSKTLYMTKEAVLAHAKKYSKSYEYNASVWQTEFDAMALKTVLRNLLSHYGYLSVEMMGAIKQELQADTEARDRDILESTAKKPLFTDVTYEVITDNGGKPDAPDPGF